VASQKWSIYEGLNWVLVLEAKKKYKFYKQSNFVFSYEINSLEYNSWKIKF
jgi:hypothetical protein